MRAYGKTLTGQSQDESTELAAAIARRSPPKLTIWTSQIRTAAREKLSVTLAHEAPANVAKRSPG